MAHPSCNCEFKILLQRARKYQLLGDSFAAPHWGSFRIPTYHPAEHQICPSDYFPPSHSLCCNQNNFFKKQNGLSYSADYFHASRCSYNKGLNAQPGLAPPCCSPACPSCWLVASLTCAPTHLCPVPLSPFLSRRPGSSQRRLAWCNLALAGLAGFTVVPALWLRFHEAEGEHFYSPANAKGLLYSISSPEDWFKKHFPLVLYASKTLVISNRFVQNDSSYYVRTII